MMSICREEFPSFCSSLFLKSSWKCNVQLPIQIINLSQNITPITVWIPKRPLCRTWNRSAGRSDLWIIWEQKLNRWHFWWLFKGVWYSWSYKTFEKKLEISGITSASLAWFRSYLTSRKEYTCIINDSKTNEQKVTL